MRVLFAGLLVAMLAITAAVPASGQSGAVPDIDRSRYSPAAFYHYAEAGDVTMQVNVWGTVRNPGLYEVPRDMRLSTLFSVAGGPAITERRQRDRRSVVVRVARMQDGRRQIIYEAVMENEIFASDEDPMMAHGDVLTVESVATERFGWRDAVTIVNAVALVALAIERFAAAAR
jgi:hypothetical protein